MDRDPGLSAGEPPVEQGVVFQGDATKEQLRALTRVAIGMGLRRTAMFTIPAGSQAGDTTIPDESTPGEVDLPPEPGVAEAREHEPFRRTGSWFSFQSFVYENYPVDENASKYVARAQKGVAARIWGAFVGAKYADKSWRARYKALTDGAEAPEPLDPSDLLDVGLPDFKHVTEKTVRDPIGVEVTFVANCDDIDIDGLSRYVVAAANRTKDLVEAGPSERSRALLKEFIPYGVPLRGMKILADYCAHMLSDDAEAAVSQDDLTAAVGTFDRLSRH